MKGIKIKGKLIAPFIMEIDDWNYIVLEEKEGKDLDGNPKTAIRTIGYFNSFGSALDEIVRRKLVQKLSGKEIQIATYIREYKLIQQSIKDIIK